MKTFRKVRLYSFFIGLVIFLFFPSLKSDAGGQSNDWKWPTSVHTIRNDWPKYSSGNYHSGTDFGVPLNTPVYSSCDGTVVSVQSLTTSYGKHIKIKSVVNGSVVYIRYCHLNSFNVVSGQKVNAGQLIAYSGSTGNSTGPHLHYEVRNANDHYGNISSPTLNPRNYLPGTSYTYEKNDNPPSEPQSPIGSIDVVTGENNSIRVRGWAFDPQNPSESIHVHVYVGGEAGNGGTGYNIVANKKRTDVGDAYGVGDNHGFDETIAVDKIGIQPVHFYAMGKLSSHMGAVTVNIRQRPIGDIDVVQGGVDSVLVKGWAFDPDEPSKQTDVHVYVGGPAGSGAPCYIIKANKERKDVGQVHGAGNYHGFSETIKTNVTGKQSVYFYVIDTEGKEPAFLGERAVTIQQGNHAPIGVIDSLEGGIDSVKLSGWSFDADDAFNPVTLHVYIGGPAGSGAPVYAIKADKKREDVGEIYKVGDYHGFSDTIKTNRTGKQMIYIYILDIGGTENTLLFTKEVEIKKGNPPDGYIDSVTGGKGFVKLHGWAYDPDDLSQTVSLHVYIGGTAGSGAPGYVIKADKKRTDLGAAFGVGDYHGYEDTISTSKRGLQDVFIYAIDVASNQGNVLLGSRKVTIGEPDHTHNYTSKTIRPATCTSEGEKQYTCACGSSYKEAIEKLPHTVVVDGAQPATCIKAGKTEGSHCSACNTVLKVSSIVPATGHKKTEIKYAKDPACEEEGFTGDVCCTDCGMILENGKAIEQLGHDYDEGVITREPTEFENGIKTHTCTRCGDKGMEIILWDGTGQESPHTHSYQEEIVKPATCAQEGEKKYSCECGESYTEVIPRLMHIWDEGAVTKPATEAEDGIRTFTCTQCGAEREEVIPAAGQQENPHTHAYKEEAVRPATCMEEGEQKYICECGESYTEVIPRLMHIWDEGMVTEPATETEDGIKTFTCTLCGGKREESIPAIGQQEPPHTHTYRAEIAKPATCTEHGEKKYSCACGESYTESIPKIAHIWDKGTITQQPTETENGIKTFTCTLCRVTKSNTVPATGKPEGGKPGDKPSNEEYLEKGDIVYDRQKTAIYKVVSVKGKEIKVEFIRLAKKRVSTANIRNVIQTEDGISCKVVSIAANALKGNKYLKKATIGSGITKIGNKAFAGCRNLTSISLGKKVSSIGNGAFEGCGKLVKIAIPEKTTRIGSKAFYNCKKLRSITIKNGRMASNSIGSNAFKGVYKRVAIQVPKSKVKAYKKLFRKKGLGIRAKVIAF
ncbi:MAG: leucine-rich repeat protein [Lachnospiraceae bacterium]|nr:leucine-rich repeat protein [Lachnospiraceae bacterium]